MNPLHVNSSITRGRETLARTLVLRRTGPVLLDLGVAAIGLAIFYAIVRIAMLWAGPPSEQMVVSLSPRSLPMYAFYSVVRIFLAYVLSLVFAVSYGYLAAYNTHVESFMIAVLDILQSIPVLSFLPPVMLAMIALFPTRHFGVELGAILLLFTGAVWNMAFSFYSSLKSIPRELREAADINRFSWLQRLVQLELPYAAIGLVWNSVMSVAGAWFTLMACEMFHFGSKDFRLPGLGSYLQTAADLKDGAAIAWGLVTMIAIIVAIDQLIWRPLIGWSDKFKFEQVESSQHVTSPLVHLFTRSTALAAIARHTTEPLNEAIYIKLAQRRKEQLARLAAHPAPQSSHSGEAARWVLLGLLGIGVLIAAERAVELVRPVTGAQYLELLKGAGATFLRVNFSLLLAAAWTIPVGVAIGSHPRLARLAQPLAQIAASVPATALFPGRPAAAHPSRRRPRHRLHRPHAAGNAVVHPVQRDRRRDGHSNGPERSRHTLPLLNRRTLEKADPARHLSFPDNRHGHSLRRRMEREHLRRVLHARRQDADHAGPGRANQRGDRQWGVPDYPAGNDPDLADGGDDESSRLAAPVPAG